MITWKDLQYPSFPAVSLVLSYRTLYVVERTPCAHPCRTQGPLRVCEHTHTAGNNVYRSRYHGLEYRPMTLVPCIRATSCVHSRAGDEVSIRNIHKNTFPSRNMRGPLKTCPSARLIPAVETDTTCTGGGTSEARMFVSDVGPWLVVRMEDICRVQSVNQTLYMFDP